jgi:hypothetical protein
MTGKPPAATPVIQAVREVRMDLKRFRSIFRVSRSVPPRSLVGMMRRRMASQLSDPEGPRVRTHGGLCLSSPKTWLPLIF